MIDRLLMQVRSEKMLAGIALLAILSAASPATAGNISGMVTDENGEPLAALIACDTNPMISTMSGVDGSYVLEIPEAGANCSAVMGDLRSDAAMLQAPATHDFRINMSGN